MYWHIAEVSFLDEGVLLKDVSFEEGNVRMFALFHHFIVQ
jgi:hypothetical protein